MSLALDETEAKGGRCLSLVLVHENRFFCKVTDKRKPREWN